MNEICSSELIDDLDDFNDNIYKSSSSSKSRLLTNELASLNSYDNSNCNKSVEYDPQLADLISNELGLNNPETTRKNPWGNLSYAELISKAILTSEDKRLTLSQIYSWIILYVPFFQDKSDKKSSQGWKNSIRHNLSLHNRFVRIPNEIAGKSSWWTIDLKAKQNRGRRKNQTNDNIKNSNRKSFISVRDINQSLYSNFHQQTNVTTPNILQHMLKSSNSQTSNSENVNDINSSIVNESCCSILDLNDDNDQSDDNEMLILKLKNQLKEIDRSNPLFRQIVLKLMRIQMNKNKLNNSREKILSTPPPSILSQSKSNDHLQINQNYSFDLDFQNILDSQTNTFNDSFFDIDDLSYL